jgi:hypothetical protein
MIKISNPVQKGVQFRPDYYGKFYTFNKRMLKEINLANKFFFKIWI